MGSTKIFLNNLYCLRLMISDMFSGTVSFILCIPATRNSDGIFYLAIASVL